jgi:hypothetical protein
MFQSGFLLCRTALGLCEKETEIGRPMKVAKQRRIFGNRVYLLRQLDPLFDTRAKAAAANQSDTIAQLPLGCAKRYWCKLHDHTNGHPLLW